MGRTGESTLLRRTRSFALALGFPVAIVLAWAFDIREGKIERTKPTASLALKSVRLPLVLVGIGLGAAAPGIIWYFVWSGHLKTTQEPAASTSTTPSIAVLPLVNLSRDPDQEYFADGLAEELLNLSPRRPVCASPLAPPRSPSKGRARR